MPTPTNYRYLMGWILIHFAFILNAQCPDGLELHHTEVIRFETDRATLSTEYENALDAAILESKSLNKVQVIIDAHTDDVGDAAYNLKLSRRRAVSIQDYLIESGKAQNTLIQYYGEERLLNSNFSIKGRAMNRRAVVNICYQADPPPIIEAEVSGRLLTGITSDAQSKIGVAAKVKITGKQVDIEIETDSSGYFEIKVPENQVLKFIAVPQNTSYETRMMMTKSTASLFKDGMMIPLKGEAVPLEKQLFKIQGKVNKEIGDTTTSLILIEGKEYEDSVYTDDKGFFEIGIPRGVTLELSAFSEGYFFKSKMINSHNRKSWSDINLNLDKIEIGKNFEMNLNFHPGTYRLLSSSVPKVHHLLKVVESAPDYCFKIDGHVNWPNKAKVNKKSFSYQLSWDRARSIAKFLTEQEVDENRISYEGFGNWHMLFPKAKNEAEYQANRRVEIRIIECTK